MPSGQKQQVSKGIPWLKEALRRLGTERPIHLIVFEEKGHLAEFEGRFRIHELGWLTEVPRMAEAYTAADLFLMPSVAENAPTMALEAMACGTPVIASDTTGMPEMVRAPVAGLVVPLGDAEALAQATQRLLGDDGRRAAMGAEARRIVEAEHGYDRYVDRHLALYESVLARTAGTR
jgi:glycosyltransferase involved in cell wall biosynthesis